MAIESDEDMSQALQELLELATPDVDILDELGHDSADELAQLQIRDFAYAMMLTSNAGFTIKLKSGAEFQITVVQK